LGSPKVTKNGFCQQPPSLEAPPSPLSFDRSAAQWRDLCVDALSWKCLKAAGLGAIPGALEQSMNRPWHGGEALVSGDALVIAEIDLLHNHG
jgi:hypothetical protein